jgi:hypothetical protein
MGFGLWVGDTHQNQCFSMQNAISISLTEILQAAERSIGAEPFKDFVLDFGNLGRILQVKSSEDQKR